MLLLGSLQMKISSDLLSVLKKVSAANKK